MMNRLPLIAALLMLTALPITACGIKPPSVDAPEGAENNGFPKTYPDPSTDPKPDTH